MKDTILIERPEPSVAKVVFNRPLTGNAYDHEFVCTLITALDDLKRDQSLKLIWLTGNGQQFCVGPDAKWLKVRQNSGRAEHQVDAEQLSRLFLTLYQFPLPVIATVRGQANADAIGILCCCDVVLACEKSSFTLSEVKFGLAPVLQAPYLVNTIGEKSARYYSLTGETIDAYTAARLGLVNKIVPQEEIDSYASVVIRRLLDTPVEVLKQTKAMLTLCTTEVFDDALVETLIDCSIDIRSGPITIDVD